VAASVKLVIRTIAIAQRSVLSIRSPLSLSLGRLPFDDCGAIRFRIPLSLDSHETGAMSESNCVSNADDVPVTRQSVLFSTERGR